MEKILTQYQIIDTTESDLPFIYWMFDEAAAYQQKNNYPVLKDYDKSVLAEDIQLSRQYKILIDDQIACIFSVCDSDELFWREKEKNNAIYLHRIVVNPYHKGQKQFQKILDWAIQHAKEKRRRFIRLDTWANNPNIIAYYQSFGFKWIEDYTTPDTEELPASHRNLSLALLEMEIK
jgi:ribosomal protein S18 acetylase RimI-like enzyme